MPQIEHTEDSTASLIDVDSPHVSSVPSDFDSQEIKTTTQAERQQHEEEDRKIAEAKAEAEKKAEEAKAKAEKVKEEAKMKAKRAAELADKNKGNPVIVGNGIAMAVIAAGLGFGAYRKNMAGELTWKLVGTWAGIVGLFAAGDIYLSK